MTTNLERYEVLRKHLPEEAARVIAEALPGTDQLVTKDYLDARLSELRENLRDETHQGFTSMHRWMLSFMATQWLGLAVVVVTIVRRG